MSYGEIGQTEPLQDAYDRLDRARDPEPVWEAWSRGEARCPYCVDCDAIEWWAICDCWMAPEPKWRLRLGRWRWRLRHPIEYLRIRFGTPEQIDLF